MKLFQFKKQVTERMLDRPMTPDQRDRFLIVCVDAGLKITAEQKKEYKEYVDVMNVFWQTPRWIENEGLVDRVRWAT